MDIKPIPTKYKHYTFRSRLEARWAIFFDGMGIKWDFEKEGFIINDTLYLPDFDLPTFQNGCFVEVKPAEFSEIELEKAINLVIATQRPLWKAVGVPDFKAYEIIFPDKEKTYTITGSPNFGIAENRMFIDAGVIDPDRVSDRYLMAVENSRSYNFS